MNYFTGVILLWQLVEILLSGSSVMAHICIRDPPQRLHTGDDLQVDCFQKTPPCGTEFTTLPAKPSYLSASSVYTVHLNMPVSHYNESNKGFYQINIAAAGSEDFTELGKWPDGSTEDILFDVNVPVSEGKYIMQAVYAPAKDRRYYSCADVIVGNSAGSNFHFDTFPAVQLLTLLLFAFMLLY